MPQPVPPPPGVAQRPVPVPPGVPSPPGTQPLVPPPPTITPPATPTVPPTAPGPLVAPPPVAPIGRPQQPNTNIGAPPQQPQIPGSPGQIPGTRPGINPPPLPQQGYNGGYPPPPPQGGGRPPRPGISPGAAAAIGAAGLVGGVIAAQQYRNYNQVREQRREIEDNGTTYFSEPGRLIERRDNSYYIRHDETERFRDLGYDIRREQRGDDFVSVYDRPGGEQIITVTDADGRLIRRTRRLRDGREIVIIDNGFGPRRPIYEDVVVLPPPPLPRERYIVDADRADEGLVYETLVAPPIAAVPRRYTLDEVRYSPDLRAHMRSVDIDTITFDTGAFEVAGDQINRLSVIAAALKKAVAANPNEVYLVEGHTDAVGADVDNLSLSDRRAQAVAEVLTRNFGIPPENLTTQGYGEQYLKEQTQGPSRINRRVTLRRITPLLGGQAQK